MLIIALCITFILRIINPRNKNIYTYLNEKYGQSVVLKYKHLMKISLKLIKGKHDENFLNICANHNLYPNFLNFKLSIKRLQSSHLQRQFQRKLLNNELRHKRSLIRQHERNYNERLCEFKECTSLVSYYLSLYWLNEYRKRYSNKIKIIHQKKLFNLGYNDIKHPPSEDVIFNFSSVNLSQDERDVLALGLNFCLTPTKPKLIQFYLPFEKLAFNLSNCSFYNKTIERENNCNSELKNIAKTSFNNLNKYKLPSNISSKQFKILKNLSRNKDIVIMKPDKGNGVVILDRIAYRDKMKDILNDDSKFQVVNSDITKLVHKLEGKITRFLKTLQKENIISDEEYSHLTPNGSTPGILYGLPKVHKTNLPMRPILSAINTHTYKLSKFIIPLISSWSKNIYTINDSFSFVNEIKNTINNNFYMASFDITSLYTNVPLNETINIILDRAFNNNNEKFKKFTRSQFRKLLELSLLDTHFIFDDILYKQVNGLAMGQPVAPTLANIFLCFYEEKWLNECPPHFKPILYKRYIDDTFLLFQENNHVDLFLSYLNTRHKCIKFTKEVEENGVLNFLDVEISKNNNEFTTSIYRKPTFTGLMMNFLSFSPFKYKINLIKTLIHRAYYISSSFLNIHREFAKITNILEKNSFKKSIILKQMKSFLNNKYSDNEPQVTEHPSKQNIFIKLPFFGNESFIIRKRLQHLIKMYYPQVKLNLIFTNDFKIANFFKFKDRIPDPLRSSVVYKYTCNRCNSIYVGMTSRHLSTRIAEHLGVSFRSGLALTSPPFSQIRNHINESPDQHHNYNLNKEQFEIITSANSKYDLIIKESLIIKTLRPNLNNIESLNLKFF